MMAIIRLADLLEGPELMAPVSREAEITRPLHTLSGKIPVEVNEYKTLGQDAHYTLREGRALVDTIYIPNFENPHMRISQRIIPLWSEGYLVWGIKRHSGEGIFNYLPTDFLSEYPEGDMTKFILEQTKLETTAGFVAMGYEPWRVLQELKLFNDHYLGFGIAVNKDLAIKTLIHVL